MSEAAAKALEQLEARASTTVTVSALSGGTLTLPLNRFIAGATDADRRLVPSLCFLLAHRDARGRRTHVLFDLGLRRDAAAYPAPIREHLRARQPADARRDVRGSLAEGGVRPADVAHVVLSHVHWDHTGTPADFPQARFWVGHGALGVLGGALGGDGGHLSHQHFERGLFDGLDAGELPRVPRGDEDGHAAAGGGDGGHGAGWRRAGDLWTYDLLGDGSVCVVDAPGHLPGHVNLLARVGERRWVYLAGDACHDRRLLTGEEDIAEWTDAAGRLCCIHADKKEAEATLARIRDLQAAASRTGLHLEVILAHEMDWAEANPGSFLPGSIPSS